MAVTFEQVAQIYVATFNRAPDAAGINYWMTQSFGGNPTIEQIASSFFDQSEAQAFYQNMTTTSALVTAAYQNLFNRAPDSDGLAYWIGEIDGGRVSQSNMLLALVNGAQDSANGLDRSIMENKATVGLAFANAGLNDTSLATFIMSSITASAESVTAAETVITESTPTAPSGSTNYNFTYEFNSSDLAGHTYYEVYSSMYEDYNPVFDPNMTISAFNYDGIRTIIFNANGTAVETDTSYPGEVLNASWSVDSSGVITLNPGDGINYMTAIAKNTTNNLILIDTASDRDALYSMAGFDQSTYDYTYYTTDYTLAQSLLGTASVLNAESALLDGIVTDSTMQIASVTGSPTYIYNGSYVEDNVFLEMIWLNVA